VPWVENCSRAAPPAPYSGVAGLRRNRRLASPGIRRPTPSPQVAAFAEIRAAAPTLASVRHLPWRHRRPAKCHPSIRERAHDNHQRCVHCSGSAYPALPCGGASGHSGACFTYRQSVPIRRDQPACPAVRRHLDDDGVSTPRAAARKQGIVALAIPWAHTGRQGGRRYPATAYCPTG